MDEEAKQKIIGEYKKTAPDEEWKRGMFQVRPWIMNRPFGVQPVESTESKLFMLEFLYGSKK